MSDKPEAYILGSIEFCGLTFKVTPDVLIPRFETEMLVKEVVSFANKDTRLKILDVGTGSACIAISIAKSLPLAQITAIDISDKALEVAKENAKAHNVLSQINFLQNNLLENYTDEIDIIVTNLPYVPRERIPTLDASVKDYEPWLALDGGPDGFDLYRKLFEQIVENNLKPKLLVAEVDDDHREIALAEAKKYFPSAKIEVKKDVSNFDRMLVIDYA